MQVTLFDRTPVLVMTPDTTEDLATLDKLRISCNLMDIQAARWAHPPGQAGQALTVGLKNVDALNQQFVGQPPPDWNKTKAKRRA